MKKSAFLFLVSSILFVACNNEFSSDLYNNSVCFVVEATLPELEDDGFTKASGNTVVRLSWEQGDKVSAINLTTGKALGGDLVADDSGTTTTFTGSLEGTVNAGDKIAILYPSQNYTVEEDFISATVDLSSQNGSTVPIVVAGVFQSPGSNVINRISLSFSFLMSYYRLNLTDLPASTNLTKVTINNVGTSAALTISSNKDELEVAPSNGSLLLTPSSPSSFATNSNGNRTLFFSAMASAAGSVRSIEVSTTTKDYASSWNTVALSGGKLYNTILADFLECYRFADNALANYCKTHCDSNSDGFIVPSEVSAITSLSVPGLGITNLSDITNMPNLSTLDCSGNSLSSLNVSNNAELTVLDCANNGISTLDVSNNTLLTNLDCSGNNISTLDLTTNSALTVLDCSSCQLTTLDVSMLTNLTKLYCFSNSIAILDVSATALGTSSEAHPLDCSPMSTLMTLKIAQSWVLPGIYPERGDDWVPNTTTITYDAPSTDTDPEEQI